jgi:hypothetical protein
MTRWVVKGTRKRKERTMKTGTLVVVNGTQIGVVKYTTADGWVGVELAGERGRVDEWNPVQVKEAE